MGKWVISMSKLDRHVCYIFFAKYLHIVKIQLHWSMCVQVMWCSNVSATEDRKLL